MGGVGGWIVVGIALWGVDVGWGLVSSPIVRLGSVY